ncbi:MAG: 3-hydroxyacyl-CoA dehydrogenase NAD-binding domain-containing protein [Rhodospirillaceae bacterium]
MEIREAAVIGAGVMGSGIAAHIANAGVPVLLLDVIPGAAAAALQRMAKTEPAAFMDGAAARRVTPGDMPADRARLAGADWIVEAVIEDAGVKAALYAGIEAVRKPGSVVSSNTSTIPLSKLVLGQSDRFVSDLMITHFFNPPRYMRLLELVAGPATRPEALALIRDFADRRLGKGVVVCRDTPGFIANRIGAFWLQAAINAAFDLGLTVEQADAVCGKPLGLPRTGVFGLIDLVGLDLLPHITRSLLASLPAGDAFRGLYREQPLFERMVLAGATGRKGGGGFYRLETRADGRRVKQAIDLVSGEYRRAEKPEFESLEAARKQPTALFDHPDRGGAYARAVMLPTLGYAAALVPEISSDLEAIDRALRLGYNWKYGPFELIDRLGGPWFARALDAAGLPMPPLVATAAGRPCYRSEAGALEALGPEGDYRPVRRAEGVLLLADIKRRSPPVVRNPSAALWDIGDGVLCLEFSSKMNTLDPLIFAMIHTAIARIGDGRGAWKALVIYNESENFSVGANLGLAMFLYNVALWDQIAERIAEGQQNLLALRNAPFPVVAAPTGLALGGGCEVLLCCDAVTAHAESYIGLVEVGVGVLPAWGGCKELLVRHSLDPRRPGGPMPAIARAFETIAMARVAKSAAEAKALHYLRPTDTIVMNRDRLLATAKARALELAADYRNPGPPAPLSLPGAAGRVALELMIEGLRLQGKATPHDVTVSRAVARVLCGGDADLTQPVSEAALLALELQEFMKLVRTPETLDRIEHMLATGKPLRN